LLLLLLGRVLWLEPEPEERTGRGTVRRQKRGSRGEETRLLWRRSWLGFVSDRLSENARDASLTRDLSSILFELLCLSGIGIFVHPILRHEVIQMERGEQLRQTDTEGGGAVRR
jgi:hypothetical protein